MKKASKAVSAGLATLAIGAGIVMAAAAPAAASTGCIGRGGVCFWENDSQKGAMILATGSHSEWQYFAGNWHDKATSASNPLGSNYYVFEDRAYAGASTYIGPYSYFSYLNGWNDRIDSSRW